MSTVTIQMPEGLAQRLTEAARAEGVTLDQFLASAASEKLSAWLTVDDLRQRAAFAKRADFIAFLDQSPSVAPIPGDE
jgi:uncharacterized protein (DUF1778 family)